MMARSVEVQLLDAFAKLRKATTISFAMSVRPYVRLMEQLGSYWKDFHDIWYLSSFRKKKNVGRIKFN